MTTAVHAAVESSFAPSEDERPEALLYPRQGRNRYKEWGNPRSDRTANT